MAFNLFGKKAADETGKLFVNKVYITTQAKLTACVQLANAQPETVFIAWFESTAESFTHFFIQNGIAASRIVKASDVTSETVQQLVPVFAEHYPLYATELALAEQIGTGTITVFSAMDEPMFKHFGSEKMIPLIKMMGFKESAAIEHSFVNEAITKGQQKIADLVTTEQPTSSQAEWMRKNLIATS